MARKLERRLYLHLREGTSTVPVKSAWNPGHNDTDYFRWLAGVVDVCGDVDSPDLFLLRCLYDKEFFWTVHNDENRAEDVRGLVEMYEEETGQNPEHDCSCSVLEVLIALAQRMNFQVGGNTASYFWEMVNNLQLFDRLDPKEINVKLDRFLYRIYSVDGHGGLFPLHRTRDDQRDIELWVQMSQYLHEKYLTAG